MISQASDESVVNSFRHVGPDLGRYTLKFSDGDVFARSGLDLKTRELATVAALAARGDAAARSVEERLPTMPSRISVIRSAEDEDDAGLHRVSVRNAHAAHA